MKKTIIFIYILVGNLFLTTASWGDENSSAQRSCESGDENCRTEATGPAACTGQCEDRKQPPGKLTDPAPAAAQKEAVRAAQGEESGVLSSGGATDRAK